MDLASEAAATAFFGRGTVRTLVVGAAATVLGISILFPRLWKDSKIEGIPNIRIRERSLPDVREEGALLTSDICRLSGEFNNQLTHARLRRVQTRRMATLEASLAKLDTMLTERIAVPMRLLAEDYIGVAGDHGSSAAADSSNCETEFRLLATAWIGSWGSILPWILPPSSVSTTAPGKTTVVLRLPQSRVRHFLTDASIHVKGGVAGSPPRISRAVLRLGTDKILQLLDSEFACNVSSVYKHGRLESEEESGILATPLFFEMPLRVLPLFIPNTQLPEIEYEITTDPQLHLTAENISFITEIVSSPGEAGIPPSTAPSLPPPQSETIVQHLPTLVTFRSSEIVEGGVVSVAVSTREGKLARALYIRVVSDICSDIADAIESIEVIGPPPRLRSLMGMPLPGSVCRTHLKRRFSKLPVGRLPYYVLQFASMPSGHVADYGLVLVEGTKVQITLSSSVLNSTGLGVEVCVETFERVSWKR